MDAFYTPTRIAESMVKYAKYEGVQPIVADFSVGGGELLRAAIARWPNAKLIGNDINPNIVAQLAKIQPSWSLSECDFLQNSGEKRSPILQQCKGKISLALLNPPFSNRGARRFDIKFKDFDVKCCRGLAFVIGAMSYLDRQGEIITVLPAGTLHSQLDKEAWQLIHRFCKFQLLARNGHKTFPDCSPKTIIVRLKLRRKPTRPKIVAEKNLKKRLRITVSIIRGNVDMTSLNGNHYRKPIPLVHTTELKANQPNLNVRKMHPDKTILTEVAVLLPRVGRPNITKLCLYLKKSPLALSTCVLAIKCKNQKEAKTVYKNLLQKWKMLEDVYCGTCASYLTVERLKLLLIQLGFDVEIGGKPQNFGLLPKT
jgi:predicted RNA methylase